MEIDNDEEDYDDDDDNDDDVVSDDVSITHIPSHTLSHANLN